MVYSAAKHNPELSLEWAKAPDVGLPRPDIAIFLDLEPEEAEKRGGYGLEIYEKKEMQERVREIFLSLQHLEKADESNDMRVVNAGASVDVVGEQVLSLVELTLRKVIAGDFGKEARRVKAW